MPKSWFYLLMAVAAVVSFAAIIRLGSSGNILAGAVVIIVSPLAMAAIRIFMEDGRPEGMFLASTQSWAFLFGDTILLPVMLGIASYSWQDPGVRASWFANSALWILAAVVVGIVAAVVFHYVLDGPNYVNSGNADLLMSPSKLWHDYVVYSSVAGGTAYLLIPVLFERLWPHGVVALVPLLIWVGLGVTHDAHLNPKNLHPPVGETSLR